MVGDDDGAFVGGKVAAAAGALVGEAVVGSAVGDLVGEEDGEFVGGKVAAAVGALVGAAVVGSAVGTWVGDGVEGT